MTLSVQASESLGSQLLEKFLDYANTNYFVAIGKSMTPVGNNSDVAESLTRDLKEAFKKHGVEVEIECLVRAPKSGAYTVHLVK